MTPREAEKVASQKGTGEPWSEGPIFFSLIVCVGHHLSCSPRIEAWLGHSRTMSQSLGSQLGGGMTFYQGKALDLGQLGLYSVPPKPPMSIFLGGGVSIPRRVSVCPPPTYGPSGNGDLNVGRYQVMGLYSHFPLLYP